LGRLREIAAIGEPASCGDKQHPRPIPKFRLFPSNDTPRCNLIEHRWDIAGAIDDDNVRSEAGVMEYCEDACSGWKSPGREQLRQMLVAVFRAMSSACH
jgi:hypothetical protein